MSGVPNDGLDSRVHRCIESAIRELNALRDSAQQLVVAPSLQLVGDGGALDSLGFVNFVVSLDAELAREFDGNASVMAELLAAPDPAEFATVEALTRFVALRLSDATA